MRIQNAITEKLKQAFDPIHLEVINESNNHSVPPGSESHFKVVMVSTLFEGKTLVNRHRMVNKELAHELANNIHALALKLMTPKQWEDLGHKHNHESPQCMSKVVSK